MFNLSREIMKNFAEKNKPNGTIITYVLVLLFFIFILSGFDKGMAVGLLLCFFLSATTLWILSLLKLANKYIFLIITIVFLSHFSAVLFLHLSQLPALGGGADFEGYNQNAIEVAHRFSGGNFSLNGLFTVHYFPVVIGIIYMFTLPEMIVGQMFIVWLACFSAILLYFLAIEIGASPKSSFIVVVIASLYPSYLYFGSLLLKDTVIVPLALTCLLITVKIVKKITITKFVLLFAILTALTHFRFYIGLAMMLAFIISWFWLSEKTARERITIGMAMVLILGFISQILGFGYYGADLLVKFLNADVITTYREVVYAPPKETFPSPVASEKSNAAKKASIVEENNITKNNIAKEIKPIDAKPSNFKENPELLLPKSADLGSGSSFKVEAGFDSPIKFAKNYFLSFVYSALGPFPWQLRYGRHAIFLLETIPLYCFLIIILITSVEKIKTEGMKMFFRTRKFAIPILIFSVVSLGALSLYINNFGIIARVRMPVFISLLAILSLSLNIKNIKINNIKLWKNI